MLFGGASLPRIWGRVLAVTGLSVLTTVLYQEIPALHISLTATPFTLIGLPLGIFLGFRVPKGARTSNWAALRLSPAQVTYAATDAWACRELLLQFRDLGLVRLQEPGTTDAAGDPSVR